MGARFCENGFQCSLGLSHFSHIVGWLGIILRILALALFASLLSKVSHNDSQIYKIIYGLLLAYFLATLIPNGCFIFGIIKVLRNFMIVYIILLAVELALGFIILIGASVVLLGLGGIKYGLILGTLSIVVLGVNYSLWLCSVILYKEMNLKPEIAEEDIDGANVYLQRFYFPSGNR